MRQRDIAPPLATKSIVTVQTIGGTSGELYSIFLVLCKKSKLEIRTTVTGQYVHVVASSFVGKKIPTAAVSTVVR